MLVFVAVFYTCSLIPAAAAASRSCLEEQSVQEEIYQVQLSKASELSENFPFYVPQCDPKTGDWLPLQSDSNNRRWCVDTETGEVISKSSEELISCTGCLASKLIIEMSLERAGQARAKVSNVFIPECQDEFPEKYDERQCWNGYFNACWCVNEKTGEATTFPSEYEVNCDTGRHHHHRAVTWCRVLESLTTSYYSVYETVKLWRHGGSNTAPNVKPEVTIQVSCDKHGRFAEEQCVGADCWCVDPETGQVIRDCSRHRNKRSLYTICQENRVQQLEAYYEFVSMGVMLEHFTIPRCTQLGVWDEIQCSNQTVDGEKSCWCVDQITGQQTTNASRTLRSCESCVAHQLRALQAGLTDFTACEETGMYYTVIQCDQDTGQCWCVDHVTGHVLHSSRHGPVTGELCEMMDELHNDKNRNSN